MLVTAAALLTACATSREASTSSESPGSQDRAGTVLAVGMAQNFLHLDPTTSISGGTNVVNSLVYEPLYRQDPFPPRSDLIPEVAADLPEQLSPTEYRITLREDITFHDGSALTADDVVFTIERILDPETNSPSRPGLEFISEIRAVSPTVVEIELAQPTTLLTERLVVVRGIVSKAAVTDDPEGTLGLSPIGSGPYQVTSAVSGQGVELDRFEGYNGSRDFHFDTITIDVAPDDNSRISGLRSGRWDIIGNVTPSAADSLTQVDDIEVGSSLGYGGNLLLFNNGEDPFEEVAIRQAMLYAIDRDAITQVSYFGAAVSGQVGVLPPDHPELESHPTSYGHDPELARDLLAAAGYSPDNPLAITFLIPDSPEDISSQAPVIEENLKAVGFDPTMVYGELEALTERVTTGNYDAALLSFDASQAGTGAEHMLRGVYAGALPEQFFFWQNEQTEQVEALLDQAFYSETPEEYAANISQAQLILHEEVPAVMLHYRNLIQAWSSDLDGYQPVPSAVFVFDGVSKSSG